MTEEKVKEIFIKHYSDLGNAFYKKTYKKRGATFNDFLNAPLTENERVVGAIFTSANIRYGDVIEEVINEFLAENGVDVKHEGKKIDLHFERDNTIYVGEVKMRDNHDSSKKEGQLKNLKTKTNAQVALNTGKKVVPFIFFVDGSEKKNHTFYAAELNKEFGNYHIFFGDEIFAFLKLTNEWDQIKQIITKVNKEYKQGKWLVSNIRNYVTSSKLSSDVKTELNRLLDNAYGKTKEA